MAEKLQGTIPFHLPHRSHDALARVQDLIRRYPVPEKAPDPGPDWLDVMADYLIEGGFGDAWDALRREIVIVTETLDLRENELAIERARRAGRALEAVHDSHMIAELESRGYLIAHDASGYRSWDEEE